MNPKAQAATELGRQVGMVIVALAVGGVVGLIPFFMDRSRDDKIVGTVGLFASMIGGIFAEIFGAGSMAIGFVIAILVGGPRA